MYLSLSELQTFKTFSVLKFAMISLFIDKSMRLLANDECRELLDQVRIRFIVENDRSTEAVPTGKTFDKLSAPDKFGYNDSCTFPPERKIALALLHSVSRRLKSTDKHFSKCFSRGSITV